MAPTEVKEMLGARIAALRRQAGMNQGELAKKLGISPSTVGMYEQGRREPSAEMLVRLAEAFSVSTDFLLTGSPAPPERERLESLLAHALSGAESPLSRRREPPFTGEELTLLLAALLRCP